ncbi:MAG: hypothetical protein WCF54_01905 [Terracidiphilus sp.]|jgi:hypothetical protein
MKKNLLINTLMVLGIALSACASAHGMAFAGKHPEIDPSLAISSLTLLGGSLAILRVRRKK